MAVNNGVRARNGIANTTEVKEEMVDVKMEDDALSTTAELNSGIATKSKPSRMLFSHLPSVKKEALSTFQEITESIYQFSDLGESQQQDVMACECKPNISADGTNIACGDNDCINFATSMECSDDECACGAACRNQRFQRREYADIDVIQTEKKGFGIRANADIPRQSFITEYIGEVIEETTFRNRMHEYDGEGIEHFYFMMIQQGEYIDATKKGGLGRFLNHSCSPNCYVDKWVVGTKLRMGIFAERNIQVGEELTFDYNVDRYGADAQPCYCGEPNCIGYIGGKTQSEAQPKLSHAVKEALGFEEGVDWATAKSRKRKRAKRDEDEDEDFVVATEQPKPVDESGVARIMSALLQARERWVIENLLDRLETSDSTPIWHRVLKMHGYQILGAVLKEWNKENNIVVSVLHILLKLPRVTKNKIDSSGIEVTVKELAESDHARVKALASNLLNEWSSLEMGFRISRRPKTSASTDSKSPTKEDAASTDSKPRTSTPTTSTSGPKQITNILHRPERPEKPHWHTDTPRSNTIADSLDFRNVPRGPAAITIPSHPNLPPGWFSAIDDQTGKRYYFRRADQKTQWEFPMEEAIAASGTHIPKSELQKILEEANRQLAKKTAAMKAEEERRREEMALVEREAEEVKARERAERKKLREQKHASQKGDDKRHHDKEGKSKLAKDFSVQFGQYVPNVIAGRYKDLTKEEVKKYARDIVHILVSKEIKAGKTHVKDELSEDKKRKIKLFVKDYMTKVMSRRAQKSSHRNDNPTGPSDSVSTTTPQVPGSTPRDGPHVDSPMSSNSKPSPEEGNEKTLSKEFLGTLE